MIEPFPQDEVEQGDGQSDERPDQPNEVVVAELDGDEWQDDVGSLVDHRTARSD